MSATMALQKQADDFEKLLAILEKADPKQIAASFAESRKQIKLIADEEAKLAEAKAFMVNYDKLKAEIDLAQKQNAQEKAVNEAEAVRLADLNKKLKAKAARLLAAAQADD